MGQVWLWFAHRVFGCELDAVRVVNDAIEYCVSQAAATGDDVGRCPRLPSEAAGSPSPRGGEPSWPGIAPALVNGRYAGTLVPLIISSAILRVHRLSPTNFVPDLGSSKVPDGTTQ